MSEFAAILACALVSLVFLAESIGPFQEIVCIVLLCIVGVFIYASPLISHWRFLRTRVNGDGQVTGELVDMSRSTSRNRLVGLELSEPLLLKKQLDQ